MPSGLAGKAFINKDAPAHSITEDALQTYPALMDLLIHLTMYKLCCEGLKQDNTVQRLCRRDNVFQHMPFVSTGRHADITDSARCVSQTGAAAEEIRGCPSNQMHPPLSPTPIQAWPHPSPEQWAEIQLSVNRANILYFRLNPRHGASNPHGPAVYTSLLTSIVKLLALLLAGTLQAPCTPHQ